VKFSPRQHTVRLLFPWILALAAYANSFRAPLAFDNRVAILEDARVHAANWQNVAALATQDYWSSTSTSWLYRPLTKISYLFNYAVLGSGANPASYHAVNFLLHALNIALVYFLGLALFAHRERGEWLALGMAAIWSVHPVLTEDVTNIVGRADLLAGAGVLGGLLCHIRLDAAQTGARVKWLAGLALAAAIGVFSKENAIVLPVAMAAYDLAYRPKSWRAGIAGYLAALPAFALYFFCREHWLSRLLEKTDVFADNPLFAANFVSARLTAMKILGKYLWLLIWPARLSADYGYNQIPLSGWRDSQPYAALAVYLSIAAAAIYCLRRRREIFFLAAFFLVALAPVANVLLLIGTIMAERFLYLPAIAFAGMVVLAADALFRRTPRAAAATLLAICVAFAARTYARNLDWQSEDRIWAAMVESSPASYRAHMGMAYSLMLSQSNDRQAIERQLEQSLAILDNLPDAQSEVKPYQNAGYWFRTQGNGRRALTVLLRGRRIDEAQAAAFTRHNQALGKTVPPQGTPQLYLELARAYELLGDRPNAIEALSAGRVIQPDPVFTDEIANVYRGAGDFQSAAAALMEGILLDPKQSNFAAELVELYRKSRPGTCAVSASGIDLSCESVRADACSAARGVIRIHLAAGRRADAAQVANTAVHDLGCRADALQ